MYVAEKLLQVLSISVEQGNPDPRDSEHWWDWRDWPFDGRQWSYEGTINRYKLDKKVHAEWKRRQNFSVGSAIKEGSGLCIERKLEGAMLWGEKKFPEGGRTCIRSSTKVACPPSERIDKFMIQLFKEATDLGKRQSYGTMQPSSGVNQSNPYPLRKNSIKRYKSSSVVVVTYLPCSILGVLMPLRRGGSKMMGVRSMHLHL